jgi:hypothetical protein
MTYAKLRRFVRVVMRWMVNFVITKKVKMKKSR